MDENYLEKIRATYTVALVVAILPPIGVLAIAGVLTWRDSAQSSLRCLQA